MGPVAAIGGQAPFGRLPRIGREARRLRALKEATLNENREALARRVLVDPAAFSGRSHTKAQVAIVHAVVEAGDLHIDDTLLAAQGQPRWAFQHVAKELKEGRAAPGAALAVSPSHQPPAGPSAADARHHRITRTFPLSPLPKLPEGFTFPSA